MAIGIHAHAEDLGAYRIQGAAGTRAPDRDGSEVLRERMAEKYRTGEAQAALRNLQRRNVDAIVNPKPLPIRTGTSQRTEFYSMDFVMPVDAPGIKKGEKVNVLKQLGRLSDTAEGLLFIDGRDEDQLKYALGMSEKKLIKIILTGGSPIKIGERFKSWNNGNGQGSDYDTGASTTPVCVCLNYAGAGFPLSFWEPEYMMDTTLTAGCMPLLGGIKIPIPWNQNQNGASHVVNGQVNGTSKRAFLHVNEYLSPVMTLLGLVVNSPCLDNRDFDIPYASWADPSWSDDTLAMVLTPYAYPFVGTASIAAEAPDSIAATIGFPIKEFFWTAGSWGPMYPVTGNLVVANTFEQMSRLSTIRIIAKLHAAGLKFSTAGDEALKSCGALGVPEFVMDKRQYRYNRLYPFPDNACTPVSRPLMAVERMTGRPQDAAMGYYVFRRKDCCQTFSEN
ncbi:hypothetical protein BGZ96_006775 [Linnemannia gamsii]|uniref:Uncharacterized protein n=1 Tax=Linnemannia gamsii TaxID=64522 RepID=A0ABQ7K408_9FUNG|nr:hypothetical protein BGZ96_006775 [Linnemannia gamsii]